jgi:anti-sigma factor RsiW
MHFKRALSGFTQNRYGEGRASIRAIPASAEPAGASRIGAETRLGAPELHAANAPPARSSRRFGALGWVIAAAILVIAVSVGLVERNAQRSEIASAGLVDEVFDQHIAFLAANHPPQVLSSDKHTVKPWFQGKIPFSFNLPENLPGDTALDGANVTYLHNQPVAQLFYSIGRHRVSIFVMAANVPRGALALSAEHSGFHVRSFHTPDLDVVAVSDADPARLSSLVNMIEKAQEGNQEQSK